MGKLTDKVAVITGGTTGIGFATAKLFVDEGAKVIVTGRSPATLEAARAELGARVEVVASDATKVGEIQELFEHVRAKYGRVDALFANAGGGAFRAFEATDEAYFDELFALNVKSVFFTVQKALPLLGRGSSVVLNTSIAGSRGYPATSVYGPAKAAVRQLARSLGAELLDRGIRVNAVSPGPVDTPIHGKLGLGEHLDDWRQQMTALNPMKRFGKAEEIARAVLFLASDDSSFVTGAELTVDGGAAHL